MIHQRQNPIKENPLFAFMAMPAVILVMVKLALVVDLIC